MYLDFQTATVNVLIFLQTTIKKAVFPNCSLLQSDIRELYIFIIGEGGRTARKRTGRQPSEFHTENKKLI